MVSEALSILRPAYEKMRWVPLQPTIQYTASDRPRFLLTCKCSSLNEATVERLGIVARRIEFRQVLAPIWSDDLYI